MYMDYLRMESEGLFLSFLPIADREPILKRWYRGALAQAKVFYGHSKLLIDTPAAIRYAGHDVKSELVEMIRDRSSFTRDKAGPSSTPTTITTAACGNLNRSDTPSQATINSDAVKNNVRLKNKAEFPVAWFHCCLKDCHNDSHRADLRHHPYGLDSDEAYPGSTKFGGLSCGHHNARPIDP